MSGARKFGLFVFGAILVVLFAGIAVTQGIGNPSIPSGDIAHVEEVPDGHGNISEESFNKAFKQASQGAPGQDGLKDSVVDQLLFQAWLVGEADERDLEVTDREIDNELTLIKQQQQLEDPKEFRDFLKQNGLTMDEARFQVKLSMLQQKIQEDIVNSVTEVPDETVEELYEQTKDGFKDEEQREIRLIVTDNKADAEAAMKALGDDPTDQEFAKAARKFSVHGSKAQGGKAAAMENAFPDPAGSAIMEAEEGTLEGPIKGDKQFHIFRVTKITPEQTKPLDEVRDQLEGQLLPSMQQQAMADFQSDFMSKWTSRTFCKDGYITARCDNFEGDGRLTDSQTGMPLADAKCFVAGAAKWAHSGDGNGCPAPILLPKPMEPGGNAGRLPILGAQNATGLPQRPVMPSDAKTEEEPLGEFPEGFDPSQMIPPG